MKKTTFLLLLVLNICLSFVIHAQEKKGFTPHSADAFHVEVGLGLGGSIGLLGGGFSVEPQYAWSDNMVIGLAINSQEFVRFFDNNGFSVHSYRLLSITPSIQLRATSKIVVPFIGVRAGIYDLTTKDIGYPISKTDLGASISVGLYIWIFKFELEKSFYETFDGSTFLHLKLRF